MAKKKKKKKKSRFAIKPWKKSEPVLATLH